MKNKKYHFNPKDLSQNNHLINNNKKRPNYSRNVNDFSNKFFSKASFPNYKNKIFSQNNFITTEQSTLLSTEDLFKNSFITNRNNCECICHENNEIIVNNIMKISNCNCPCHFCENLILNCQNNQHNQYNNNISKNNIKKDYGRYSRSVDFSEEINISLIDKYNDLNKKYKNIKKHLDYLELEEKQRNNYIKNLEDKLQDKLFNTRR